MFLLWGITDNTLLFPMLITRKFQSSTNNLVLVNKEDKATSELMEKFIGCFDGDGHIDISPQKQYNKSYALRSLIIIIYLRQLLELDLLYNYIKKIKNY